MAVAPYPHIEMHVRDDSIATLLNVSTMPLDKPLFMIRAQKGKVGVPEWCPTFSAAVLKFGADTFNKRSKYYSESSYFLMKTLVSNGAYIMRCAEETAVSARVFVELGVKETDVPQWQRNSITGAFTLDDMGNRIKISASGAPVGVVTEETAGAKKYAETTDTAIVAGKEYFARKYAAYTYLPIRDLVADKDMVVYFGVGTPTPTRVEFADVLSDPNEMYYAEVETEGGAKTYEPVEATNVSELDPSKFYCTLSYPTYDAKIVHPEDDLTDKVYFKRQPKVAEGFDYVKLSDLVEGVMPGDKIGTLGDITRVVDGTTFDPVDTGLGIEDGKEYWCSVNGEMQLASPDGTLTEFEEGKEYFVKVPSNTTVFIGNAGSALFECTGTLEIGDMEPQATISGLKLVWRAILRNVNDDRPFDATEPTESEGFVWYPMATIVAKSPGAWGQAFGFRFYFDRSANTMAGVRSNGAITYSFAPVELKEGDTTPTAINDAFGQQVIKGTIKEGVVDPSTDLEIDFKTLIPGQYKDSHELPCSITFIQDNFEAVGRQVMLKELQAKDEMAALYPDLFKNGVSTFVEDVLDITEGEATEDDVNAVDGIGHMANVVSGVAPNGVPYFASTVVGSFDEAAGAPNVIADALDLNGEGAFFLKGGVDGDISDFAIERYQRAYISAAIAGDQDYLIDYLRCQYNSLIDTGVSLQTKKAYLDFMGIRDNLTVFLTPQQTWKDENGNYPKLLSRYEDESVGAALRAYALLMREDIDNATEANRACIFLSGGYNSDHNWNGNLVASTLWIALKNAENYCKTYIFRETGERPNSEITCYDKGMVWTAASEETRSRCWNAGLNYPQYADIDVIHYASVRSVYRYDTSVLSDIGTVRAVTFAKDVIRKEWAIWSGSKRFADDLNQRITKALNDKVGAMLNNKYTFSVNVYQTDEDKKAGYVRHVDLEVTSPATNRVWVSTIILKREGFDPNAEA